MIGSDYDKNHGFISSEAIGNLPHMMKTWYYYNHTGWVEDKTMRVRPVLLKQAEETLGEFSAEGSCVSQPAFYYVSGLIAQKADHLNIFGSHYSCGSMCLPLDLPCNGSCLQNRCLGDYHYHYIIILSLSLNSIF